MFGEGERPTIGDFVQVRGRTWLVEGAEAALAIGPPRVSLACVDDDAQGERLEVVWDAEIAPEILPAEDWASLAGGGPNDAATFAAYYRTAQWTAATSADPSLFQAPFRAGIRLDPYQLEPLRKALLLPRVNLLIADDVGLGKTIEAGLIVRELLLRRRIDTIVVAAPASMTIQWREELESKFGITLRPIDRVQIAELRKARGYAANPWLADSRFVISHQLLIDEGYVAGLRDFLGKLRPKSLLIIDEAHHAAPASSQRYAIDSQFTKAVRDIAGRFEHRLFLTATPHNGHRNSFSALMEMLDSNRFTRGVPIEDGERDLKEVMVRRLKEDLRQLGEAFPERVVEPIVLDEVSANAPELVLAAELAAYGELRQRRLSSLARRKGASEQLVFIALQTRLLSSIAAFARTLERHRASMLKAIDGASARLSEEQTAMLLAGQGPDEADQGETPEFEALRARESEEDAAIEAATLIGAAGAERAQLAAELAQVEAMLKIAQPARHQPDARVRWLIAWIEEHLRPGGEWNERRLILFTEWEDTRKWLEAQLREALDDHDHRRTGVISGVTRPKQREDLKRAFNADPAEAPLRILICTDAAREGINLQRRCDTLIHIDLPWNPSRLEQRNGRIDRKLQPAKQVFCRYFFYPGRPEDRVLQALVRKTEVIRRQLGSAGQVLGEGIKDRLATTGIVRARVDELALEIRDAADQERQKIARRDLADDEVRRRARLATELDSLRRQIDRAKKRVGVPPEELKGVVEAAVRLARQVAHRPEGPAHLAQAQTSEDLTVPAFELSPDDPAFAGDPAWAEAFDALRIRPRETDEAVNAWRTAAPVRPISFRPPVTTEGRDDDKVVQVHLEHRLVRRLLSRFQSVGFQHDLSRACVIESTGGMRRVVLLARLSLYGPGAARLHEEILAVTAQWTDPAGRRGPLIPFGDEGEASTLAELDLALADPRAPRAGIIERMLESLADDIEDLKGTMIERVEVLAKEKTAELARIGAKEGAAFRKLLEDQLRRIDKELGETQEELAFDPIERRQRLDDRRHMAAKRESLATDMVSAEAKVAAGYGVQARRLEPIGVVYLSPGSV